MPRIIKRVFYSEILDRWMSINVTQTTLDLVDDAFGFDNYILKVDVENSNETNIVSLVTSF